jgi:UDP-N-acetylglucosamine transferase subunit ALG13
VGSILVATNAGHTPIVVPRLKRFGEHVDDHQVHLIDELERLGKVIVVHDVADLPAAVADAPPRQAPAARRSGPLQDAVRAALYGGRPTRALTGRATVSAATRG